MGSKTSAPKNESIPVPKVVTNRTLIPCTTCHVQVKKRHMRKHLKSRCANSTVKCDVCQQIEESRGEHKCMVSCVFCSNRIEYREISTHLRNCSSLDDLLMSKYNSKNEIVLGSSFVDVCNQIKSIIVRKNDPKCLDLRQSILQSMLYCDTHSVYRLFYCAKQFNFNILHCPSRDIQLHHFGYNPSNVFNSTYRDDPFHEFNSPLMIVYEIFPTEIFPDIKFILGKNLTADMIKKLHHRGKIRVLFSEIFDFKLFIIDVLIADGIYFEFVNNTEFAKSYFDKVKKRLQDHLNVYVSQMIIDYSVEKSSLE
jgi:hypothetical protein